MLHTSYTRPCGVPHNHQNSHCPIYQYKFAARALGPGLLSAVSLVTTLRLLATAWLRWPQGFKGLWRSARRGFLCPPTDVMPWASEEAVLVVKDVLSCLG